MLLSSLFKRYWLQFIISLSVGIAVVAVKVEHNFLDIFLTFLGSFLGLWFLQVDYFIQAYWNDPDTEFSVGLKTLISAKNYSGIIAYISKQRFATSKMLIHSALVQSILLITVITFTLTSESVLGIAFCLSALINLIYEMYDQLEETKSVSGWFWILKKEPSPMAQKIYMIAIFIATGATLVLLTPR